MAECEVSRAEATEAAHLTALLTTSPRAKALARAGAATRAECIVLAAYKRRRVAAFATADPACRERSSKTVT